MTTVDGSRGSFRALGWDPAAHQREYRRRCAVLDRAPGLVTLTDVLYLPAGPGEDGARYSGSLISGGVEHGVLSRGGRPYAASRPAPPQARGGTALYLGWLFDAYGHVLLESLARIWALHAADYDTLLFHRPYRTPPAQRTRDLLTLAGVDLRRVATPTIPTLYDAVHVPEPTFEIRRGAHRLTRDVFAALPGVEPSSDRPAFVSRSRLPGAARIVRGEAILEARLERAGFRILHPQELSVARQAAAFRAHPAYVGLEGSAMHNLLFAGQRPRAVYLTAGAPNSNYRLCDEIAEVEALYVACCGAEESAPGGELTLDVDAALAALADEGLI